MKAGKPRRNYKAILFRELSFDILQNDWEKDLNSDQISALYRAGIVPFSRAVVYRTESALCSAIVDYMADGKLAVGEHLLEITEKNIHRLTALPSSGRDVTDFPPQEHIALALSLTNSEENIDPKRGLMVDSILDPAIHFAAKFLVYRLLGIVQGKFIPFKDIQTAIEVSQGVEFNWCKFIKERMLYQIGRIQKNRRGNFNYPTILQALALEAFNNASIPSKVIADGEPYINAFILFGRSVAKTLVEKRKTREIISSILDRIVKHVQAVDSPSFRGKKCAHSRQKQRIDYVFPTGNLAVECLQSSLEKEREISNSLPVGKAYAIKKRRTTIRRPRKNLGSIDHFLQGEKSSSVVDSCNKQVMSERELQSFHGKSSELQGRELSIIVLDKQVDIEEKLNALRTEISQLLAQKISMQTERGKWAANKTALEIDIMLLTQEKQQAVAKRQEAHQEKLQLQEEYLKHVQLGNMLQRELDKLVNRF